MTTEFSVADLVETDSYSSVSNNFERQSTGECVFVECVSTKFT